ncbi:MAG: hypothetical protein QOD98_3020 [Nocardioidaceae bacterium]|nr:hypothetical protein [Nocardioidaceae bacterium]
MISQHRRRPAMAIGLLVLGLMLGLVLGTTVAAVAAPPTTKAIKKIVAKQVKKLAPSLAVAHAADADALGGAPASAYLRTSGVRADGVATSADIDVTTGPVTLLSKTFVAPTDGFVFVVATLYGRQKSAVGGYGLLSYKIVLDATPLTPDNQYHQLVTHDENFGDSGSVSAVVPVAAGSHTVGLQVFENGAGTVVNGRDLSMIFTPSGSAPVLPY